MPSSFASTQRGAALRKSLGFNVTAVDELLRLIRQALGKGSADTQEPWTAVTCGLSTAVSDSGVPNAAAPTKPMHPRSRLPQSAASRAASRSTRQANRGRTGGSKALALNTPGTGNSQVATQQDATQPSQGPDQHPVKAIAATPCTGPPRRR